MIQTITDNNKFSRSIQIEQIVAKRQPLVNQIETVQNNLNFMSNLVSEIGDKRDRLLEQVDDVTIVTKLEHIDCRSIVNQISTELNALEKLKSRFSRRTLNIGVVGRARQGKSRLLQSLTGLSKAEIPDGDDQHCTGVRSNIYHHAGIETYAEVYFHSEHSFLNEVIAPYYHQLSLGVVPLSLETFANFPLPEIDTVKAALDKAKYKHLGQYHQHINQYRQFFSQTVPKRISKEQIREYVAQDTVEGDRTYFAYLAVKKVDIYCSFPNQDIGQISLVDMPGLGDTGIGDAERLIKTLGQDIDIVLFMRMPKSMGDVWAEVDVDLYDLANSALTDLPINEWSFMVLNHVATIDNYKNCISLKNDITNQHIDVQDVIICDCANKTEAQTAILDRVIDYLTHRIDILDNKYASACQYRLLELQRQIKEELDKADVAFGQATSYDWSRYSVRLFHKLWNELRENLEGLTRSMIRHRDAEDINFKLAVIQAIKHCRNHPGVPSVEQILKKRDRHGSFESAYSECQHEVRTRLSKRFLNLNIALRESLDKSKSQVSNVLAEYAKLKYVAKGEGTDFLLDIESKIPEDLADLKLGFSTLATFDLQYHGLIQHRIRKHLDVLTPDRTRYKFNDLFSNFFGQPNSNEEKAKKIYHHLCQAQIEAVSNCEKELKNILVEPSQAGFAIVEEFVDRVVRAEGMREEWEIFLQEFASQIWQEKFESVNASSLLKKEWIDTVKQAQNKNNLEDFKFN
ncbi:hypothetical protein [Pleurocapsa sp. FMAR1]|uniref:hypothetical protein n=1 Tax=Pleurocapsa sp. FMAR1 TaxID=3040204 RepID=UPI0029C94231|nr:hypothetical protein [Pleurocapsa sp. FMAR1]